MKEAGDSRSVSVMASGLALAIVLAPLGCAASRGTADGSAAQGGGSGTGGSGGDGGGRAGGAGGAGEPCATSTSGEALVAWLANGRPECAYTINGSHTISRSSPEESVFITAATASNSHNLIISLHSYTGPVVGTHVCARDAGSGIVTIDLAYDSGYATECTISIDTAGSPGVNLTGSFSASVPLGAGQVAEITNGRLDTPVAGP